MTQRAEIVAEARTWLDTPWKHQANVKGVGVDCINLVHEAMVGTGAHPRVVIPAYRTRPDGTLQKYLEQYMRRIQKSEVQAADVLLFTGGFRHPSHVALATGPNSIIHAFIGNRKVVEHSLDARWLSWIVAAYTLEGLE